MATKDARASRDIPDYHAVLAADIKDFTKNTDIHNRMLARRLPQVVSEAFARSGLDFSDVRFPGQAGDGYAAGIDYHKLPHLIHPVLDQLQVVLTELNAEIRGHGPGMRLRVSIHIGPLPGEDDADGAAGIGKAMNDLHRLLDAEPARLALRDTDPETTFVAAVISQRAYEDAISSGFCALLGGVFVPIPVQVKQFSSGAWLYVPKPSGDALHRAFMKNAGAQAADSPYGQTVASSEHIPITTQSDGSAANFHIGNAGQVANNVTAPVSIRQKFYGGDHSPDVSPRPDTSTQLSPDGESS
jgi:hypothetical protein